MEIQRVHSGSLDTVYTLKDAESYSNDEALLL
jgi:hypothetical protein